MKRPEARMNGQAGQRGFSLVELLVTIAILTIIVSLGVPLYSQFTRDSAISGATSELVALVGEARSRAVAEREGIVVSRLLDDADDGDWSGGWDSSRVADGERLQLVDRGGARGNMIAVIEVNDVNSVTFDREGRATPALEFQVCRINDPGQRGRTIEVSAIGRVSITGFDCP